MEQATLIERGGADVKPPPVAPTLPLAQKPTASTLVATEPSEVEWIRGPIGQDVSYRIIVKGTMGAKEIGKLIRVLKAQQIALSDDDEADEK